MTKKHFRTLNLFFSFTFILFFNKDTKACGGDYFHVYEEYPSIFNAALLSDPKLAYFTNYQSEFDYPSYSNQMENVHTWIKHTKTTAAENDIYDFVYNFGLEDLNNLYYHLEKGKPLNIPDSVKNNSFSQYFFKSRDFESLGYLIFAKKCSNLLSELDQWTYEAIQIDASETTKFTKWGMQLLTAAKHDFIKERYAFLIQRNLAYTQQYSKCIEVNKIVKKLYVSQNSIVTGWIEGLLGKCYKYGEKNNKQAIIHWVNMYKLDKFKYFEASMSINWTNVDFNTASQFFTEPGDILALSKLMLTTAPEYSNKEIIRLAKDNINDPILEALALRQFQKLEQKDKTAEMKNLFQSVQVFCESPNVKRKSYWLLLGAACALELNNTNEANITFKKLESHKMTADENKELVILKSLYNMKIDNEEELNNNLSWINSNIVSNTQIYTDIPIFSYMKNYIYAHYVSQYFKAKNNDIKYFYALLLSENYTDWRNDYKPIETIRKFSTIYFSLAGNYLMNSKTTNKQINTLYEFAIQPHTNTFEKQIAQAIHKNVFLDVLATKSIQQYNFEEARSYMEKADYTKFEKIAVGIFVDYQKHKFYRENTLEGEMGEYTKFDFVNLMIEKKRKMEQGDEMATYDYANALYNISYFGHNWLMSDYYWTSYFFKDSNNEGYFKNYYCNAQVEKIFSSLAEKTKNNSLKANCYFMAALCKQGEMIENNDFDGLKFAHQARKSSYFEKIIHVPDYDKQKFSWACSYFSDYTKKN